MNKYLLGAGLVLLFLGPPGAQAQDQPLSMKEKAETYLSQCIWSSHYAKPRTPVFAEEQQEEDQLLATSSQLRQRLALLLARPSLKPSPTKVGAAELQAVALPTLPPPESFVEEQVEMVDESTEEPDSVENDVLTLDYRAGQIAQIPVAADYLTDIQLQPGERLERITLGDAEDWQVQSFLDEAKDAYHVYLKPLYENSNSNIILSTDRHSYQLELVNSQEPTAMVRWCYPGEEEQAPAPRKVVLATVAPEKLNFDYQVEKKYFISWQPRHVFDDGSQTYIAMEPDVLKAINPAIFTKDGEGNLVLVDYKKIEDKLVIAAVLDNLQLHVDHTLLNIQRRKPHV